MLTEILATVALLLSMYATARLYKPQPPLGRVWFMPPAIDAVVIDHHMSSLSFSIDESLGREPFWTDIGYHEDGWTVES